MVLSLLGAKVLRSESSIIRGESRNSEVPEPMASAQSASLYWGSGGLAPSGVQGQSPWSGGQGGEAPLKLKALLYFKAAYAVFRAYFNQIHKCFSLYKFIIIMTLKSEVAELRYEVAELELRLTFTTGSNIINVPL